MGGAVAITIREEDGEEHRMCRWTNGTQWFFKNICFLDKDSLHVERYLKGWYGAHYEKGKMRPESDYADHPFLAPVEYGLVVVDMAREVILDYQRYTAIDTIHDVSFAEEMFQYGEEAFYMDNENEAMCFRELLEAEKIVEAINTRTGKPVDISDKSLQDVLTMINTANERNSHLKFRIDMQPYHHIKYGMADPLSPVQMQDKIKELGFRLTSQEEQLWDRWIKEKLSTQSTSGIVN